MMNWLGAGRRREKRWVAEESARIEGEITAFGERLARHAFQPEHPGASEEMASDYADALDAYERASRALPQDLVQATQALDDGTHALATLDARLAGMPLPERLPLCFFDPRHGRSVRQVRWAPQGGATRLIPVCAADAVRLAERQPPVSTALPAPPVQPEPDSVRATPRPKKVEELPAERPSPSSGTAVRRASGKPRKPRFRDRYPAKWFWTAYATAAFAVYAVLLLLLGEFGKFRWELIIILFFVVRGPDLLDEDIDIRQFFRTPLETASDLWSIARRGRLVQADYLRKIETRDGWQHEFSFTNSAGKQIVYRYGAPDGEVLPLPYRKVWYVSADETLHTFWTPVRRMVALPIDTAVVLTASAVLLIAVFVILTPFIYAL